MKIKMFELRDKGTFIPVMCIKMDSRGAHQEDYLLGRAGFGKHTYLVQLVWMSAGKTQYDPFKWNDRTFYTAHKYITENWDKLISGDVIDVEFILGETDKPKKSESEEK